MTPRERHQSSGRNLPRTSERLRKPEKSGALWGWGLLAALGLAAAVGWFALRGPKPEIHGEPVWDEHHSKSRVHLLLHNDGQYGDIYVTVTLTKPANVSKTICVTLDAKNSKEVYVPFDDLPVAERGAFTVKAEPKSGLGCTAREP